MGEMLAIALNAWTLLVAGGIFLGLRALQGFKWLSNRPAYRRLLPILPEALGVLAAFTGGLPAVAGQPIAIKVAAGLWCAYLSQKFRKILGQSLLGDDRVIAAKMMEKMLEKQENEK